MMNKNNVKILIVEDENIIAKDIQQTVVRLGYSVSDIVNSGEEAIKSIEQKLADVILMDIMLKGELSGIETAQIISRHFSIPVVYLSALTDEETLQKAKLTEPFGFVLKPFDGKELHNTIEIALYKHKMETELRKRNKEIEEEKKRSEELLHHILPADIVKELKLKGEVRPRLYELITICFIEFYGFSDLSSKLSPHKLVNELHDIFKDFDTIIENHGIEKMKTIGLTYMVVGGLSGDIDNHAVNIIKAGLDMLKYLIDRNKNSDIKWMIKAGVNSGQVVAGIVGSNKFIFDVWGDTVNIASRIISSSESGKINVSGTTYELIKDAFVCEYRGKLAAKGKGEIDMYFVTDVPD